MFKKSKIIWPKNKNKIFSHRSLKLGRFKIIGLILLVVIIIAGGFWWQNRPKPQPTAIKTTTTSVKKAIVQPNWELKIDKLAISAPIILNVDGADKDAYFKTLQSGVAQMKDTALPGEGNTVIFGHSNFYEDDPGKYKKVFATLDQLVIGDEIKIINKNETLTYIVSINKLVDPTNVNVVKPTQNKQLTLITCWPPGTIDQRLIVVADLKK